MKYLDKIFGRNKEDVKDKIKIIYENDTIKHEVFEWVKYLGKDSFSNILLEIGFNEGDTIYLYGKSYKNLEFYYSINEDVKNSENTIKLSYGAFKDRGATITILNGNKEISYAIRNNNKFVIDLEKIYVSDLTEYTRYYFSHSSIMFFNSKVGDKDYILKLCILKNLNEDDIFKLDNEMELEKYLCSLVLPCDLLDVFKRICEICKIDSTKYDSFDLELHKKNKRFQYESDVISHIKFMHGEFRSISYIKDDKKIYYNSSGEWSYEMLDEDELVKLSIEVKKDNVNCKINSNNQCEMDDYFKDLLLYDMNSAKNEIENVKKLVRNNLNK